MKYFLTLLFILLRFWALSQTKLPVIQAISNQAKIYEYNNAVSNWGINPKIKLDVHSTGKLSKPVWVKFKTDIDSLSFKLEPGSYKDFIVLLNGRDSCVTRIQSAEMKDFSKLTLAIRDTIPFSINRFNTNYLPVVLNGTDSLMLNFDSGATEICITTDALNQKVKSQPKLYSTAHDIKIGNRVFKSAIYDIAIAGNEVDGLLGWNLFDGMIVELDYDNQRMIVHSKMPKQILADKHYEKFKLTYIKNKPFIESEILQSGTRSKSLFFFDLGYQKALMLDPDVLTASRFPTKDMVVIKKVIMHGTKGNEVPVITANLESLKIGKFQLKNVPSQIMTQGKPMPGVNVHYLGSDVLKKFNTVLDFQKNIIYLKPNHFYDTEYADQKKNGV
ncbi:retropepsin-like aspartic protease [Mucilaginibacter lacusdianchii]|uniref:retropepsin-like aspartic protease n=1 Tax=Mucilaginibacter lacusdianchii TaxID=2684211 RepID=UPI00131AF699|nr:retropepsin-like aspartic protease [Mucilaginibacter sp. JXJ CY 39]